MHEEDGRLVNCVSPGKGPQGKLGGRCRECGKLQNLLGITYATCPVVAGVQFRGSENGSLTPRSALSPSFAVIDMAPRPTSWNQGRQYGIVIDAGSSGSRVQVYSWINPEIAKQTRKANKESVDVLSKVEKGVEHGDGWHLKAEPGGFARLFSRPKAH